MSVTLTVLPAAVYPAAETGISAPVVYRTLTVAANEEAGSSASRKLSARQSGRKKPASRAGGKGRLMMRAVRRVECSRGVKGKSKRGARRGLLAR